MFWLIMHQWILLFLAFLLGLLIGWWIWAKRQVEKTGAATKPLAASDASTTVSDYAAMTSSVPDDKHRPKLFDDPSDGRPDDLKKISGVGPKLEGVLNGIGVFYYRQVRDWAPEHVAWIDDKLPFPGRIIRDKWQEQAGILANGDDTEFASRYEKGETPSSYDGSDKK